MRSELISIVIPIYNVEKYLNRCLETIVNQTYKNLEIILVDDGSTDNSGIICDEYAKNDKRIKVYHKKNGGSSSARNYGIKKANGKYIGFIDADDYIDLDMYQVLYDSCKKHNCDIAWCNKYIENEKEKYREQSIYEHSAKLTQKKAYELILLSDASLCDKLFKKEIFDDIKFIEGSLYEDIMPLCYAMNKSEYVYFINKAKYHYIQRSGSNVHHFDLRKLDYTKNANLFRKFVLDRYSDLNEVTDAYYILVLCTLISDMFDDRKKYKEKYNDQINELKSYKKSYLKNKYIPKSKKVMCFMIIHRCIGTVNILKSLRNKLRYK